MLKMKIYSIDLKLDDNNYSSFSGWFISDLTEVRTRFVPNGTFFVPN